jgi:hypothetical protein
MSTKKNYCSHAKKKPIAQIGRIRATRFFQKYRNLLNQESLKILPQNRPKLMLLKR